jgi:hypothetical protein
MAGLPRGARSRSRKGSSVRGRSPEANGPGWPGDTARLCAGAAGHEPLEDRFLERARAEDVAGADRSGPSFEDAPEVVRRAPPEREDERLDRPELLAPPGEDVAQPRSVVEAGQLEVVPDPDSGVVEPREIEVAVVLLY